MASKKTITLSFKIDDELNQRIEKCMKEENRSKSNFVITVLSDYLDQVDNAKKIMEKRLG